MPPFKAGGSLFIGIFFDLFRFFLDKNTWHGVCSILSAVKRPMDWVTTNKSL